MLLGRQGGDVGTGYQGVVAEQQEKLLTREMLFGRLRAIKNRGGLLRRSLLTFEEAVLGQEWARGQLEENVGQ